MRPLPTPRMENLMEKSMENEMAAGVMALWCSKGTQDFGNQQESNSFLVAWLPM